MITILSKLFLALTSEKLPRYTLKSIKSGGYTKEELDIICKIVKDDYTRYKKGFKASVVMVFFIVSLILCLGFYQGAYRAFLIEMLILYIVIFTLMFILIYVKKVNKIRKTFLKAVKKGYPELYNEYEDKLYEYVD